MAAPLQVLIASVLAQPAPVQRKIAALVGSVVADAASQHLQWIYDQSGLVSTVGDENPEFWKENKCPYFNLANGKLSCYGEEVLTTLKSVASTNATLNIDNLYDTMRSTFKDPSSPYQVALAKRPEKNYPIDGPWLNGGIIKCFDNVEKGVRPTGCPENHDADGFCLSLPIVIQKNDEAFEATSKSVVQILTTNDVTLAYNEVQAKMIQEYVNGEADPISKAKSEFSGSHPEVVAGIESVETAKKSGEDVQALVKKFGLSCSLPGSFLSSLVSLLDAPSYAAGVRQNMLAGGDCCSRSIFIGACLGAKFGIGNIPLEWMEKVEDIENIVKMVEQIMS